MSNLSDNNLKHATEHVEVSKNEIIIAVVFLILSFIITCGISFGAYYFLFGHTPLSF